MDSRLVFSLSLCVFLLFSDPCHAGWLNNAKKTGSLLRMTTDSSSSSDGFDPTRVIQLSWNPRAFLYKGFLTEYECDHLIKLAKDKLEISMVADNESGKSIASEVRTSSGMFLQKAQDLTKHPLLAFKFHRINLRIDHSSVRRSFFTILQAYNDKTTKLLGILASDKVVRMSSWISRGACDEVVARIEQRIAAWTFLPAENGESIQILRYELGQKYEPHFDYFHDKVNQQLGGHRIATVLMYLASVKKGGETVFPNAKGIEQPKEEDWSDCAKKGYAVKPEKGDALLFFSLHPDATTDASSLHGSCPVIEGEKWSATKWIHVRSFDKSAMVASSDCTDENPNCPMWAAAGECKKNPFYMTGNEEVKGFCRQSCKVC